MTKRDDDIQMLYEWWLRNGDGSERPGVIEGDAFKELMDIVWELVMSTDSEVDTRGECCCCGASDWTTDEYKGKRVRVCKNCQWQEEMPNANETA